ncbi:UvrD-helicase domain-containing protein [Paractinoplanes deccanensis]|uniref:UvrD-helicase domain-containing protein n=1 Tax=Paractinoplanes deccanensis TaxID=113561 RepID=UPI00360A98C3
MIGDSRDELLAEVRRATTQAGPDFTAAIGAAQNELVRTPAESLLVIHGGPGTGKTITALRRVAWLLDDPGTKLSAADVLVVGPSPAYARRSRTLLEGWGHTGVTHRSVAGLLPKAEADRPESLYVTRLKGEARMAGLLGRALEGHPKIIPDGTPATVTVRGRAVTLDPATVQRVITTARASEASSGDRRRLLRAVLVAGSPDPALVLEAADLLAELIWPEFDPAVFLRDLFASRDRLSAAAGEEFTDREINALYRPGSDSGLGSGSHSGLGHGSDSHSGLGHGSSSGLGFGFGFSEADLALLDEATHLAGAAPDRFAHVLVDEAQDLSPMQLRAISRRSANGALTLVGDMAQSTGPWARDDWHEVLAHLPSPMPHVHRELRFGYRVPRQIFDLAAELLPTAAPSVQPPTTVRDGPADPVIAPVADPTDRAAVVVAAAAGHAAEGRSVAIVCPHRCRDDIAALLDREQLDWHADPATDPPITLLAPHETKGLDFEAAIVVEPGLIVDDDPRGHRLLYIALTRATSHLHLVGAPEDLPADFTAVSAPPAQAPPSDGHPPAQAPPSDGHPPAQAPPSDGHPPAQAPPSDGRPPAQAPPSDGRPPAQAVASAGSAPSAQATPEDVAPEPPAPVVSAPPVPLDPAVREQIDMVAHALAETLLANLTPELWPVALDRLIELISPDP